MFYAHTRLAAIWYTLILVGIGAAITAAAACFLIDFVASFNISWTWLRPPAQFYITTAISSLLIGPCLWWHLIIKPGKLTVKRGSWVGLLGSILVHPLAWFLLTLLALVVQGSTPGSLSFSLAMGFILLPLTSLITVGWLTGIIGGLAGALVAALQQKFSCQERWQAALLEH